MADEHVAGEVGMVDEEHGSPAKTVYAKLGVGSRRSAVDAAQATGLLEPARFS